MTKTWLFQAITSSAIKMIQTPSMSHTGNLMGSLFPKKEAYTEASVLLTSAAFF